MEKGENLSEFRKVLVIGISIDTFGSNFPGRLLGIFLLFSP